MSKRTIFFNEKLHKYTDEFSNTYISATTLIGKYESKFDEKKYQIARACEKIGKNPYHNKYLKYKNKTAAQLIAEWEQAAVIGCNRGNIRHNYLEESIKTSTNYKTVEDTKFINDTIYTIDDILINHNYGRLTLDHFVKTGIKERYPKIYNTLLYFDSLGAKIYSEIGVYESTWLVSGLIDILIVIDDTFYILDWKTNKGDIRFDSGYYDKDKEGNLTNTWIDTDDMFKYPLNKLVCSTGNKYAMQLSLYSYLTECFGLRLIGIILAHIQHELYELGDKDVEDDSTLIGKEKVKMMEMPYLKNEVIDMIAHYEINKSK